MEHEHLPSEEIYTVSQINGMAKHLLKDAFGFFWLKGEISELSFQQTGTGHVYMTLKDEAGNTIRGAYFGGRNDIINQEIKVGSNIEGYGSLDIYEKSGSFQFVIRVIKLMGAGELNRRYEALKAKLEAEGLFDIARKKPLPPLPKCIGLLTSSSAAAYTDFMRILNKKFPDMHVRMIPVPVQGAGSAAKIIAALKYLNETQACDVIVITRGGGSIEDLWEFNDEELARAVAASAIPVISAVGHERDFTICDYVADVRAATPTAAAETVVQGQAEMRDAVKHAYRHLISAMQLFISDIQLRWQRIENSPVFQHPEDLLNVQGQRLDTAAMRLTALSQTVIGQLENRCTALRQQMLNAVTRHNQEKASRQEQAEAMLRALNPKNVLSRGYSILFDKNKRAIRCTLEAQPGDDLHAVLSMGEIDVKVTKQF